MTADPGGVVDGFIEALLDDDAEKLYDRAPCGYLSTTPDGTIVKVNRTFLALVGYERDELVGRRRFAELLSAGGRIYHETHYAPMLRMHGSAREIALELACKDGSRRPVLVNSVLDRDEAGRPTVVRTAVFDASQRREYERELLRAKERAEASEEHAVKLARTLQQTLIPPAPPVIPGLDVAAAYRPAGDGSVVGGDFYDVFEVGAGDWVVVIGDVCGKGAEAAVVTALARYTVRAAAVQDPSPVHALAVLNDVLVDHEAQRFCTVACVRLRRRDGGWRASVACGGHPLPLLRRAGSADVVPVGTPGTVVGVLPESSLTEATVELEPGDLLVLYTDGVPEGRDPAGAFYGEDRLRAVVAAAADDVHEVTEALLADVLGFQAGRTRDDVAIVALGVPPAAPRG